MAKDNSSPPKASSSGETVDATTPQRPVSPTLLKQLAESVKTNQKMLAALMQAQRQTQEREDARVPKRRRRRGRLEFESSDDSEAQPNANMQRTPAKGGAMKPTRSQRQRSSANEVEAEDLFTPVMLPRMEKEDGEDSEGRDRINEDYDDEDETRDQECEIISTEDTRRLNSVPKTAGLVKNAAELRRLLEDINLYHLPRNQTKFLIWYQRTAGGVFHKEAVKSIHQSIDSAFFCLQSGTVLKFPRQSSQRS